MQTDSKAHDHYDVLVVGFGPAGAVAAGMLGKLGHKTLVVDRLTGIYEKPRAIAIDHEILRHFDNMGLAEKMAPYLAPFTASQHFGAQGQLIRRIDMVPPPYPLGYTPSMVFTQPPVEAVLREHAAGFDAVTVELGVELVALSQNSDVATASLRDAAGGTRSVSANYVIGCDGASSAVRELVGIRLEDLIFDEPWLVIDVQVHDHGLAKLPQSSAQFCTPARPTSFVMGPGNHRRWEIMLLPGENPREMEPADRAWALLSPWLMPEDGVLWRAAAYRFHALVADKWRKGRVLIAGDAAHQQPPFIGQGMCQGLRDVTNLMWKLDRVMKGRSPDSLLDSYGVERKRHVKELTGKIKAIGEMICIRDPDEAAARDRRILADGGGKPLTITRQEIVPPLQEGLIAQADVPARGTLFPQPSIRRGEGDRLLDGITGAGWRLFIDGRSDLPMPPGSLVDETIGLTSYRIHSSDAAPEPPDGLQERENVMSAWFDRHQVKAALVRPDHYVFSTARDSKELHGQLSELQRVLN